MRIKVIVCSVLEDKKLQTMMLKLNFIKYSLAILSLRLKPCDLFIDFSLI